MIPNLHDQLLDDIQYWDEMARWDEITLHTSFSARGHGWDERDFSDEMRGMASHDEENRGYLFVLGELCIYKIRCLAVFFFLFFSSSSLQSASRYFESVY